MKSAPTLKNLPASLQRQLSRKAEASHRTIEGEIIHRLERSLEHDHAEESLAAHLRRALAAPRTPMKPDDVLAWAEETFDQLERPARQK
jgi:hypothetical protein